MFFSFVDGLVFIKMTNGYSLLSMLFVFAIIIPTVTVSVRRLHDIGKNGWWLLLLLIPFIGPLILFIFFITDSAPGTNKYGKNPKGVTVANVSSGRNKRKGLVLLLWPFVGLFLTLVFWVIFPRIITALINNYELSSSITGMGTMILSLLGIVCILGIFISVPFGIVYLTKKS